VGDICGGEISSSFNRLGFRIENYRGKAPSI
jgi:hypothetical protein